MYVSSDTGLYRSDDAGQTWEPAGQGLPNGPIGALTLDPRAPQRLYVAASDGALYLSEDGAGSWRSLSPAKTEKRG